jgi:phosphate transport system substrate-binding protein
VLKRAVFTALALLIAGCSSGSGGTTLTGAGSSFDYPFFSKAFDTYSSQHPDVTVNYQSIGSGGGIQQFIQKTIDFGASDVPMNGDELTRAGQPVIQMPVALGGVVLSYNVNGVPSGLRLDGDAIAGIYLGRIKSWNDPRLKALNPGVNLPNTAIVVVHRSEASGTSYIFTDYLSSVSTEWKTKVGKGKAVSWPASGSVGGKGNEGVAGLIRATPGAIGYVELAYALENNMATAAIKNSSGAWVACSPNTVQAAAASKPNVTNTDFSIVDRPGARSYPISGYSWVMVYTKPADPKRGRMIQNVLQWLDGNQAQQIAASLHYVALPVNVQASAQRALQSMNL